MAIKKYTVSVEVTAEENDFLKYRTTMEGLPHVTKFQVIKTEEVSRVQYPVRGAKAITYISITFNKKVSKDRVEGIVDYWNSIGYVQVAKEANWVNGNCSVVFDGKANSSSNLDSHNILEQLLKFLEEGTPVRKLYPYGQALGGLGANTVRSIRGI